MLSPFIINDKNLFLDRFPISQVNRSLQAWDAADEYLINYITEQVLVKKNSSILIFNDTFGALTTNLSIDGNPVYCVNDSLLSEQGIKHNLEQNHLSTGNVHYLTSLEPLPSNIDLVVYKIPKSKSLLNYQLLEIKNTYPEHLIFIAGDRAKEIHSSTLKIFEKHLGTTTTSLALKKARLVFCQLDQKNKQQSPFPTIWDLEPTYPVTTKFTISNHANVYARDKLDLGARYLLQSLPNVAQGAKVIDLGCGNGVLGLTVLAAQPLAEIHFVDESYMAIDSAKSNIEKNLPEQLAQCEFTVNDCLTNINERNIDLVLCNPPFHQQTATTDHIAWQMFNDAFRVLKKGGELRIIGNRQLGYHVKLKRIFGNYNEIATNNKFVTLSAKRL
jgi:16S rRNA G1207 methylase RsmC